MSGQRNRWSLYKNVKDEYVIVKEVVQNLDIDTYSYIHAIRDVDDLEPFVELSSEEKIDDLFK